MKEKQRVMVVGALGRMGRTVVEAVEGAEDLQVCSTVDIGQNLVREIQRQAPQVAVDFTTPAVVEGNLRHYLEQGVHPVVGTTGLSPQALQELCAQAKSTQLGGIVAPNFAIGAVLMMELARQAARHLQNVEILEYHHPGKLDAPSGTALLTREKLSAELPEGHEVSIHSVRLPGFLAHQEVIFGGAGERLSIRHDSLDRSCFMPGVLLAIRRVPQLKELVVGLENLL
ncbi:MAG: dihydrodipicolinate reductase C-terminal domain-containing protein [Planctomycetota bacterium]